MVAVMILGYSILVYFDLNVSDTFFSRNKGWHQVELLCLKTIIGTQRISTYYDLISVVDRYRLEQEELSALITALDLTVFSHAHQLCFPEPYPLRWQAGLTTRSQSTVYACSIERHRSGVRSKKKRSRPPFTKLV